MKRSAGISGRRIPQPPTARHACAWGAAPNTVSLRASLPDRQSMRLSCPAPLPVRPESLPPLCPIGPAHRRYDRPHQDLLSAACRRASCQQLSVQRRPSFRGRRQPCRSTSLQIGWRGGQMLGLGTAHHPIVPAPATPKRHSPADAGPVSDEPPVVVVGPVAALWAVARPALIGEFLGLVVYVGPVLPARTGGGPEKPPNLFLNAVFGSMQVWNAKRHESGEGAARQRRGTRAGALAHSTRETKSSLWAGTGGMWHPNPKRNIWYRVWYATKSPACECEYHTTGGQCRCKRMAIVERLLLLRQNQSTIPKKSSWNGSV